MTVVRSIRLVDSWVECFVVEGREVWSLVISADATAASVKTSDVIVPGDVKSKRGSSTELVPETEPALESQKIDRLKEIVCSDKINPDVLRRGRKMLNEPVLNFDRLKS